MFQSNVLKNAPFDSPVTIMVTTEDSNWEECYLNWISGKNPTDSVEWKKGVISVYDPKYPNNTVKTKMFP